MPLGLDFVPVTFIPDEIFRVNVGGAPFRVLAWLWSISGDSDGRTFAMISRADLEDDLDMPRGTLDSALLRLKTDGHITYGRGKIGKASGSGYYLSRLSLPDVE